MYKAYPKYDRKQQMNGNWTVSLQTNKHSSPRVLFEHIDKEKAKKYEELHRQGRIK